MPARLAARRRPPVGGALFSWTWGPVPNDRDWYSNENLGGIDCRAAEVSLFDSNPGQALVAPMRPPSRRRCAGDDPAGPALVAGVDNALRERLDAGLAALGLAASQAQRDALIAYLALLARWNQAYNLTAVRDPLEMVGRHLLDSLTLGPYLFGDSVLDLGTGAGLPGIPLALLHPQRRFWLLDGNGKKARFVRQAVMELGLRNCEVVHGRMESYRPGRKFATIVARAVASLTELRALGEPLLDRPGRLLLMKGREPEAELNDLSPTAADLRIHRLVVPFVVGERHLIEVRCD